LGTAKIFHYRLACMCDSHATLENVRPPTTLQICPRNLRASEAGREYFPKPWPINSCQIRSLHRHWTETPTASSCHFLSSSIHLAECLRPTYHTTWPKHPRGQRHCCARQASHPQRESKVVVKTEVEDGPKNVFLEKRFYRCGHEPTSLFDESFIEVIYVWQLAEPIKDEWQKLYTMP